ncbi:hypothetical protein ACLK1T_13905 [Escherichia coli]
MLTPRTTGSHSVVFSTGAAAVVLLYRAGPFSETYYWDCLFHHAGAGGKWSGRFAEMHGR